jgi:hypothetical protein
MNRRVAVPAALVLVATLVTLGQAGWNRSLVRREIVLGEREAPVAFAQREETALWLRLEYATPFDSTPGGWIGPARLASLGIDTSSTASARWRPAVRSAFAVLELDGPAWREHVERQLAQRARELALDSVPSRRDSLLAQQRDMLQRGSHLVLVDVGPDAAALAQRYPDAAHHLVLPARVRTYPDYRFIGVNAPPDTVLGASVDLVNARLLVSGRSAASLRPPPASGYRVTVATGRAWAPWVRRLE